MGLRAWWRRFRSSRDGRFVTEEAAREYPDETYGQRMARAPRVEPAPVLTDAVQPPPAEACTGEPSVIIGPTAKVKRKADKIRAKR